MNRKHKILFVPLLCVLSSRLKALLKRMKKSTKKNYNFFLISYFLITVAHITYYTPSYPSPSFKTSYRVLYFISSPLFFSLPFLRFIFLIKLFDFRLLIFIKIMYLRRCFSFYFISFFISCCCCCHCYCYYCC